MLLGAALVVVGGLVLYYAVTGRDPRDVIRGEEGENAWSTPAEVPSGGTTGGASDLFTGIFGSEGTPQTRLIIASLRVIPGWRIGRICGPGSVPGSDHPCCGAVDIVGPRSVLFAVQRAAVAAMRARALPIAYVIGPDDKCPKGRYYGRDGSSHCYTGPNSHQSHVHISAWPMCHEAAS